NLGWAFYKMGDFEKSLDYFKAAVEKAHAREAFKDEAIWENNLGLVYFETGQTAIARECNRKSLELAYKTKSADLVLASLNALSFVSMKADQLAEAAQYSEQALDLSHHI